MTQPEELRKNEPLKWSTGTGADVWRMFQAALAGDLEAIQTLLAKDASLVRCHHGYRTPLYFAVRENNVEAARLLLERGADPFGVGLPDSLLGVAHDRGYEAMASMLRPMYASKLNASERGNAVAAAIRKGSPEEVRSLLDAQPELLHLGDERSNQPIHWAVMTRQLGLIDELLKRGADINARRHDGARPIHLFNGDYHYRGWRDVPGDAQATPAEVLAHLIARGAQVDIWTAAHMGDLRRVRALLDETPTLVNRNSDYNSYYLGCGSPLRNAAAKGHMDIVRLLLQRGADPNLPQEGMAPDGHALYSAVYNGHYEIAKLLLEKGANPSAAVESSADALSIAIRNGDQPMIELLCSYGATRSVEILAYYGDVQTAAAIFAIQPALANDSEALANAAQEGHTPFVRLMLRYCPELPKRSFLTGAKTRELAGLLFEHGLNPNRMNWLGVAPLHHIARKGDLEMAAMFIEHGADRQARDEDLGLTPLQWAMKFGQSAMVELLK